MPSESVKQNQSPSEHRNQHKQLDREIREMVSAITNRVTDFHKSGSTHNFDDNNNKDDDEHGVRIITLAGTNDGATLKSELDDKTWKSTYSSDHGEPEPLSTFVNSNFQAINNSMMLGGSFHANDPGVHLDISDFSDPPHHPQSPYHNKAEKNKKKGKMAKKKEKSGSSKSEQHSSSSDDDDDDDSHSY